MEGKSVFISSCSRRDLARRRPGGWLFPNRLLLLVVLVAAVAFGVFALANGGI